MTLQGFFSVSNKAKPELKQNTISNKKMPVPNLMTKEGIKLAEIIDIVKNSAYIQGQNICPICAGILNYRYSAFEGFIEYECLMNNCLPFPEVKEW